MPTIIPLASIKHRLPPDCWFVERQERDASAFEGAQVLLFEGDAWLPSLDLGFEAPLPIREGETGRGERDEADRDVCLILVTGKLEVAGPILNAETDGATGLVVLGDLHARDVIVGGQEIRVCGDLVVDQLFWGDYNHGSLRVDGRARARVWLLTDQYDAEVRGKLTAEVVLDEEAEDAVPSEEEHVARCFAQPLMLELPENPGEARHGEWLDREAALECARSGTPLLQPSFAEAPWPARLSSGEITPENVQALLSTPIIPAGAKRAGLWEGDDYFRVGRWGNEVPSGEGGVYLQREGWGYFFKVERVSGLRTLLPKARPFRLVRQYADLAAEEPRWLDLDGAGPEHHEYVERMWPRWLALLARAEVDWVRLTAEVTLERVEAILRLPFVTSYPPDPDGGDTCEWFGNECYVFRQKGEQKAMVSASRYNEFLTGEGDQDLSHHLFKIAEDDAGQKRLELEYQPRQEVDGEECLDSYPLVERPREIAKAWRGFLRLEKNLVEANRRFLAEKSARAEAIAAQTLPEPAWLDLPSGEGGEAGEAPPHHFRFATLREAHELIGDLCFIGTEAKLFDVLNDSSFDPESYFLVSDGDLSSKHLELSVPGGEVEVGGLIIRGNLDLASYLVDLDEGLPVPLIVLGDLRAPSMALGAFTCLVTGDLHCECLVGVPSVSCECGCACDAPREGTLYVNGRLRADAIVGDASKIYAGELACRALCEGTELRSWSTVVDPSGERSRRLDLVPSTCRASDVLEGSVLEDEDGLPDRGALVRAFLAGESVIDRSKLELLPPGADGAAGEREEAELPTFEECLDRVRRQLFTEGAAFSPAAVEADLDELVEGARESFGPRSGEVAQALELLSVLAAKRGDHEAVLRHGKECLAIHAESGALTDRALFYLHYRLAESAIALRDLDTALAQVDATIGRHLAAPELTRSQVLFLSKWRGYVLHEAGRHEAALENNRTLLREAQALLGADHPDQCSLLINMAQNHYMLKQPDEARACLERCLTIARAHDRAAETDSALFQLGVLACERGDAPAARRWMKERLEHARATEDDELVESAKRSLAETEERLRKG